MPGVQRKCPAHSGQEEVGPANRLKCQRTGAPGGQQFGAGHLKQIEEPRRLRLTAPPFVMFDTEGCGVCNAAASGGRRDCPEPVLLLLPNSRALPLASFPYHKFACMRPAFPRVTGDEDYRGWAVRLDLRPAVEQKTREVEVIDLFSFAVSLKLRMPVRRFETLQSRLF